VEHFEQYSIEQCSVLGRGGGAGGAGGSLAPPCFGDLFSKFWEFLKIHFSLFTIAPP